VNVSAAWMAVQLADKLVVLMDGLEVAELGCWTVVKRVSPKVWNLVVTMVAYLDYFLVALMVVTLVGLLAAEKVAVLDDWLVASSVLQSDAGKVELMAALKDGVMAWS